MNSFATYLTNSAPEIKTEVDALLSAWKKVVNKQTPSLNHLHDLFFASFIGGKFIRGALVKLGYELTDSRPNKNIIKIAAAFEILQTALLIHDDIIDQSLLRRGKATLHTAIKNQQYGLAQAICFGDLGLVLATKIINETTLDAKLKTTIISHFSQLVLETILGQMLDAQASFENKKTTQTVATIQKLKTAQYSIAGPLTIGAMLGKAKPKQLAALKKFGENIGIAFQIQDDILGVFGDEKKLGKSTTSDIEENKNTLLISYALNHADKQQQALLKKYYGKKGLTKKEQLSVKNIFTTTGALRYSQQQAKDYTASGLTVIPALTTDKKMQQIFRDLASFITNRQK